MAAIASMHGVFNKKAPGQKPSFVDEGDSEDIQALLKKRRAIDEDEDYFPVDKY